MFHSITNKIKGYRHVNKKLHSLFEERGNYLQSGYYIVDIVANKPIAYLDNKHTKEFIQKISNPSYIKQHKGLKKVKFNLLKLLKKVILKNLHNQNKKNDFDAEILMLTREGNIKLFDLKNKKVVSFLEKDEFDRLKDIYKSFVNYFPMTYVLFEKQNYRVVEKLINFEVYTELNDCYKEFSFLEIQKYYNQYFNHIDKNSIRMTTSTDIAESLKSSIKSEELTRKLIELIDPVNNNFELPEINSHGDFTSNNVLFIENELYIIDWEDSGVYIFLYDIFNYIFVEILFRRNFLYFENYMSGKYDKFMFTAFKNFEIVYMKNKKMIYFYLFIAQRLTKFENEVKRNNSKAIYENYIDVLNTISLQY